MRSIAGEPDAHQIGHVICSQSFTAARVRSKLPDNQVGEPFRVALIVRVIEVRISKHVRFESPRPRKRFLQSGGPAIRSKRRWRQLQSQNPEG